MNPSVKLRIPGIIGGAGPGSTADLYLDIMDRCRQVRLTRRPAILVASMGVDLTKEELMFRGKAGYDIYLDAMLHAGRVLAEAGADFLAMPCNTLHAMLPELRAAVALPIVSILEAVTYEIDTRSCRIVGLLSTSQTVAAGLYANQLQARGIEVVTLPTELQTRLDTQIKSEVDAPGQIIQPDLGAAIHEIFAARGVCAVIAGCTELKILLAGWAAPAPVVDSLDVLGAAVFRAMMAGEPR